MREVRRTTLYRLLTRDDDGEVIEKLQDCCLTINIGGGFPHGTMAIEACCVVPTNENDEWLVKLDLIPCDGLVRVRDQNGNVTQTIEALTRHEWPDLSEWIDPTLESVDSLTEFAKRICGEDVRYESSRDIEEQPSESTDLYRSFAPRDGSAVVVFRTMSGRCVLSFTIEPRQQVVEEVAS